MLFDMATLLGETVLLGVTVLFGVAVLLGETLLGLALGLPKQAALGRVRRLPPGGPARLARRRRRRGRARGGTAKVRACAQPELSGQCGRDRRRHQNPRAVSNVCIKINLPNLDADATSNGCSINLAGLVWPTPRHSSG
ncbi:hypothetical protein [Glycomyces sambucus]|uniref:hypothetical protein n=1 Tax=Glycomyces sambucus TaxID=380244 RepID=UPI0011600A9B|nr:hypothetical protein [Glycomyces sambucus]